MEWIVTDRVYEETWRRLLEFSNHDLTFEQISIRHGPAIDQSQKQNYKKQAQQIRACVLQAKEYFDAALATSIYTSPNHIYYGCVALASAMMLIFGTGNVALDVLRKAKGNAHHGLEFTTGCNVKQASTGLQLLNNSYAEILNRGHFKNWYATLPPISPVFGNTSAQTGNGRLQGFGAIGSFGLCDPAKMPGRKMSILDILKQLPDLSREFPRYGITLSRARSTVVRNLANLNVTYQWTFHQFGTDEEPLLDAFYMTPRSMGHVALDAKRDGGSCVVTASYVDDGSVPFDLNWPDMRDTLDHTTISYAHKIDTPEVVDCYLLAYQLSMLSRYFPDLWIGCIESHCKAAKLIELVARVLCLKFPMLALSMLTPGGLIISTHREPWKQL